MLTWGLGGLWLCSFGLQVPPPPNLNVLVFVSACSFRFLSDMG